METRLLVAGVLLIVGGEALCILGPLRYERLVHVICHVLLYSGVVLAGFGAFLHWRVPANPERNRVQE